MGDVDSLIQQCYHARWTPDSLLSPPSIHGHMSDNTQLLQPAMEPQQGENSGEIAKPKVTVVLAGLDADVEKLAKYYGDMETGWIRKERGAWVLSSVEIDEAADDLDAVCRARDAIEHQNNAMYLQSGYRGVDVGDQVWFRHNGRWHEYVKIRSFVKITMRTTIHKVGSLDSQKPREDLDPHVFARLVKNDDCVRQLSAHLPKLREDWVSLYDFAEAIGRLIPGAQSARGIRMLKAAVNLGWITDGERRSFAKAANMARHVTANDRRNLMTPSWGFDLMTSLARKLLEHFASDGS